ncbi:EAL domain-containing protein [Pseudoalteromonas sp. JC3]|uniref:EAL domain-containing protein n=1 Tax=Pseudoalteromonas sp. JC3 TaxID=2810196 RepID=UPI0020BFA8A4|nr:EAL domain-containing protein [Pseudoalteromonas sp. JC3]WJE08475.1 EAL domain-containing protein [Pseudoalteromonas sp. JC3]
MNNRVISINLKQTLTWGTVLCGLVLTSLIISISYVSQRYMLLNTYETNLRQDLSHLGRHLFTEFVEGNDNQISLTLKDYYSDGKYKALFLIQGETLINETQHSASGLQIFNQVISQAQATATLRTLDLTVAFDPNQQHFLAAIPISPKVPVVESADLVRLIAIYDISTIFLALRQQLITTASILAVFLILIIIALLSFTHYFIHKPIKRLIQVGNALSTKSLSSRADIVGHGELGVLAKQFNVMAQTLEKNWQQQLQSTQELQRRHALINSVFEALPDIFFIINTDGTILECHTGKSDDLYMSPEQFINKKMSEVLPSHAAKHFSQAIKSANQRHQLTQIEYPLTIADQAKLFEARLSPIPGTDQLVIAVRDITEKKRQEEVILHHAFYDSLTDLPNRFLAMERLAQQLFDAERNDELAVVFFIDLDDFKRINDSLGHETGDQILIASGERLKQSLREQDTVSRLSGDEFIVLMGGFKHTADITSVADMLIKLFHHPIIVDDKDFNISVSIGVAIYPLDANSPQELLSCADTAMYNAKSNGRNNYCLFNQKMSQQLSRRIEIEEALRVALNEHELEVFYQPQFYIENSDVFGAEALLRWHSKTLGNVSPAEFIPVAEQSGLIIDIGLFVLSTAINQAHQWQQHLDSDIRIAINLSPRQFKDPSLLKQIELLVKDIPIANRFIELEITEGVLISGQAQVKQTLTQLHQLGFKLSLDDFGTGYSSLNYLRHYPFDLLKIDRSFISDMLTTHESKALVKTIIAMAHNLSMKVVAEGVETLEQLRLLQQLECDFGQGYLISKPLSAAQFESFYHTKIEPVKRSS